jgi:hypothetical protein
MQGTGAIIDRVVTPADVLAFLNADYRVRAGVDPDVDTGETLDPATTIDEWRLICDLVGTRQLAHVLNKWLEMEEPVTAWHRVLNPEKTRTLGDLAAFVAPRSRWPGFAAVRVAGVEDEAVGAFFAIRGVMARAGLPVSGLRPSTPLTSFTQQNLVDLATALTRAAPEVVPVPEVVEHRRQRVGGSLLAIGFVAFLLASLTTRWIYLPALLLAIPGLIMARGAPAAVNLAPYETVGDIARAMAHGRRGAR